jgi:hypothetical protein
MTCLNLRHHDYTTNKFLGLLQICAPSYANSNNLFMQPGFIKVLIGDDLSRIAEKFPQRPIKRWWP